MVYAKIYPLFLVPLFQSEDDALNIDHLTAHASHSVLCKLVTNKLLNFLLLNKLLPAKLALTKPLLVV